MAQDNDAALEAINALRESGGDLSFGWLRGLFGAQKSADIYKSLNYGRAVITSEDQLNQYLYSYGPMIASQWDVASEFLTSQAVGKGARWIDYGCGQGLAGLLIRERLGQALFDNVRTTVLVEPSRPALKRAKEVYKFVTPKSTIVGVRKAFSDLLEDDLVPQNDGNTVHIFSNVLDIKGYNHLALLGTALSVGRHIIVAVGHDRDHNGGSGSVAKLKAAVEHPRMASQITVSASTLKTFKCANRDEPAILWHCQLDVNDE